MPAGPWPVDPLLAALGEALPAARRGRRSKGVHTLRVATRRIDAWLRLGGWHVLRDDLRWLRTLAGPVRDLDVLLAAHPRPGRGRRGAPPPGSDAAAAPGAAAPGPDPRAELRAARRVALAALRRGLDEPRVQALLDALAALPPVDERGARAGVRRLARRLLDLPCDPTVPEAVHHRRRLLRRLRYALELLGEDTAALVSLQDSLGVVSDRILARRWAAVLRAPSETTAAPDPAPAAAPDPAAPVAADAPDPALDAALAAAEAAWTRHLPLLRAYRRWTSSSSATPPPSTPTPPRSSTSESSPPTPDAP